MFLNAILCIGVNISLCLFFENKCDADGVGNENSDKENIRLCLIMSFWVLKKLTEVFVISNIKIVAKQIIIYFNFSSILKAHSQIEVHFLALESPLKIMKNAFYFTLKALSVLKMFNFLF